MSIAYIPDSVKYRLWGKSAGRCEYDGCNEQLWIDPLTRAEFNQAYIAHIFADSPGGPRYHPEYSERLKSDMTNLMLLCDRHHRLIDLEDVLGHPAERLQVMKLAHESRIEIVSNIAADKPSAVVLYGANIGDHSAVVNYRDAAMAIVPERYPHAVQIPMGLLNSLQTARDAGYWDSERGHLQRHVELHLRPQHCIQCYIVQYGSCRAISEDFIVNIG